ncbi:MAG: exosortase/archaeosortase family protein, partial [Pirellula sp.]
MKNEPVMMCTAFLGCWPEANGSWLNPNASFKSPAHRISQRDVDADRWATDPQYSHCYLVPLFSLWLLWDRRGMISGQNCRPSWFGIFVLLLAIAIRQYSAVLFVNTIESAMIPIALAGVVLCIGGWKALNWAWPALAYLFFIVPLPYRVQT